MAYWYIAFIYNYRCGCVLILSVGVTWFVSRDGLMWFEYSVFLMDTVMMSSLLRLLRHLTNLNVVIN